MHLDIIIIKEICNANWLIYVEVITRINQYNTENDLVHIYFRSQFCNFAHVWLVNVCNIRCMLKQIDHRLH
jgi:hypothetical protein